MFNQLTALGFGLISFAIVLGVGVVVLGKFTASIAGCQTGWTYESNGTATFATGTCCNSSNSGSSAGANAVPGQGAYNCAGVNSSPTSTGAANVYYLTGSSGLTGLATWTPAIIALAVGILFLGAFMMRKGKNY